MDNFYQQNIKRHSIHPKDINQEFKKDETLNNQ